MLAAGTRLGPYEIVAPLGAGGMGEVYRARDTRLSREVAVKVLPQHLGAEPEVRARFEREARTVSSLNHPHICTLFDVGREGDTDYLVMELVEGDTLAARLAKGPLALDQVLRLGTQLADALERAHRAGVVHRDLKPGNVMLTKAGAKLMDFGLARATGLAGPAGGSGVTVAALTRSPTVATPLTTEGAIVGTFQYMSPEQLEGREADVRSDVWALGCVLYEMTTGQSAFSGKSQASLIGSIMSAEPKPLTQLAPVAPPALERLVKGCLAKDPDGRPQSAQEVKLHLAWIAEGGSQSGVPAPELGGVRRGRTPLLAWALAGAAVLAAGAFGTLWWSAAHRPQPVLRFEIRVPSALTPAGPLRVSPDGRVTAFAASDSSGVSRLWVRSFDDLECRPLPGTEGAGRPFWSPDSRYLGYFTGGRLYKVLVAGGRPETVCEAPGGSDGTWSSHDWILFDGDRAHNRIRAVKASGGDPVVATPVDSTRGELEADWPEALPDGERFLFIMNYAGGKPSKLCIGRIGKPGIPVMEQPSRVEFVPPGMLLYERDAALLAQRLDLGSGKRVGEPHTLVDQIGVQLANQMPYFSASRNGVLVYSRGNSDHYRVGWVDRTGRPSGDPLFSGAVTSLALSADGRMVAYQQSDASGSANDIWVRDLQRGVSSRVTTDPGDDIWPVWGPDSRTLYWASNRKGRYSIYTRSLDRLGPDSLVYAVSVNAGPVDVSPDGRWLSVMAVRTEGGFSLSAVPLQGGGEPVAIGPPEASATQGRFSPDGRWVAYASGVSGRTEIYVRAFPGPSPPIQVTSAGGISPHWRSDGRELFFRSVDQRLFSVDVKTQGLFDAGQPRPLQGLPPGLPAGSRTMVSWTPSADGQHFLLIQADQAESSWLPVAVFGWAKGLKK